MPATPAEQWAAAIDTCTRSLARQQYAPSTVERVMKHVRAYARACPELGPWEATPASLNRWLDGVECTERSRYSMRSSLRTFYRWAHKAGRIETDPTEAASRRLRPYPPAAGWAEAIAEHRQWLKAAGSTAETIHLRTDQLTRLSRETGIPTPWQVTTPDLAEWLARHRWGRETARSHRTAVRRFYAWAVKAGKTSHNPAEDLPVIRPADSPRRPASDDAYARALSTAAPRERLMLRLAAELGLRRAEIAQVHQWDLRPAGDGWWLEVHGKGGKTRHVPVPDDLADLLRDQGAGHVFPGDVEGHLSPRYVGKLTTKLLPRGVTLHCLRHRFATRAYAGSGGNLLAVQQLLGHSSPTTTQHYIRLPDSALRATMAAAR